MKFIITCCIFIKEKNEILEVAMSILKNEEPRLWKYFDDIRKIPRSSGNETAIGNYVISIADKLGLDSEKDDTGNVLIRKPGSPGHENAPVIVLQSHLDMVCEKNSDKKFDFSQDEIQLIKDGDWLKADGTTLGADNGIGVAATLAILEDDTLVHGPIEAVFTVDEETGLKGAMNLSNKWLKGRTMINLDSEDIGIFSIGCAGGRDTNITLPITTKNPSGNKAVRIFLSGLRGGHSGIDIHEGRGNAIKILNRLIFQLTKVLPVELSSLNGGDKHNAIPREAYAHIVIANERLVEFKNWFQNIIKEIQLEFQPVEKNITISVEEIEKPAQVLTDKSQQQILALIFALPHGVLAMSRTIKNLVETSNNVAAVKSTNNEIKVLCSSRSSNMAALQATLDKLNAITALAQAHSEQPPGYPGWMPDLDSKVLKVALETYKEVSGKEAKYEAIHAGLECGLIGEKFPGMDMISIGPTLKHPHSPDERVHIGSVEIFYKHVIRMLEVLV